MILNEVEILMNLSVATNIGTTMYQTIKAKVDFTYLRQIFTKAPIFRHFDPESDIQIITNISNYVMDKVLSQLTLNSLG